MCKLIRHQQNVEIKHFSIQGVKNVRRHYSISYYSSSVDHLILKPYRFQKTIQYQRIHNVSTLAIVLYDIKLGVYVKGVQRARHLLLIFHTYVLHIKLIVILITQ